MEQEYKVLLLSEEAFYKLYKAGIGDVVNGQHCQLTENGTSDPIDGQYRKVNGAFQTDDRRTSITADGLLRREQSYMLTFKDLSDGSLYYMSERLRPAPAPSEGPLFSYSSYYYEPPASASNFECVAQSARCNTRVVHIYTIDSTPN